MHIPNHRFYEGKKNLGAMYNSLRNANVAFCSFLRPDAPGEKHHDPANEFSMREKLRKDHIELRRLSSVLYAFIRQSVREHRHGYPTISSSSPTSPSNAGAGGGDVAGAAVGAASSTKKVADRKLVSEDLFGKPSLGDLLTEREKAEYSNIDFNNRPNIVVSQMQAGQPTIDELDYIVFGPGKPYIF